MTVWNSLEDARGFADGDSDRAVFYPVFYPDDDRFLLDRELTIRHYEIAFEDGD
jgi:hypothetical protein